MSDLTIGSSSSFIPLNEYFLCFIQDLGIELKYMH